MKKLLLALIVACALVGVGFAAWHLTGSYWAIEVVEETPEINQFGTTITSSDITNL